MQRIIVDPGKIHELKSDVKGVYIIYDDKKTPIYIGKSTNSVRERLIDHFKTKFPIEYASTIEVVVSVNKSEIDSLEIQLISEYKPTYNFQIKRTHDVFMENRKFIDFDVLAKLDAYSKENKMPKHQILTEALSLFFEEKG